MNENPFDDVLMWAMELTNHTRSTYPGKVCQDGTPSEIPSEIIDEKEVIDNGK